MPSSSHRPRHRRRGAATWKKGINNIPGEPVVLPGIDQLEAERFRCIRSWSSRSRSKARQSDAVSTRRDALSAVAAHQRHPRSPAGRKLPDQGDPEFQMVGLGRSNHDDEERRQATDTATRTPVRTGRYRAGAETWPPFAPLRGTVDRSAGAELARSAARRGGTMGAAPWTHGRQPSGSIPARQSNEKSPALRPAFLVAWRSQRGPSLY